MSFSQFECRRRMTWWMYALISAVAASATAVLAKPAVQDIPSNLATAVRTIVVLGFAWIMVFVTGQQTGFKDLKGKALVFLILSGIGTGVSWLAYFKALQMAPASRVAPIDKLSLAFTMVLAALMLGEKISLCTGAGAGLMVIGALLTLDKS